MMFNDGKKGNGRENTTKVNFSIGDVHNQKFYTETSTGVAYDNSQN